MSSIIIATLITGPTIYGILTFNKKLKYIPKQNRLNSKWKYIDFNHYEMSRDADKRIYIEWDKRDKNLEWWKEQYNNQYNGIN